MVTADEITISPNLAAVNPCFARTAIFFVGPRLINITVHAIRDTVTFLEVEMARLRSPNYPSVPLREAVGMVEKIHAVERNYPVDRTVAAQHLGFTGLTGHSAKILASLLQYGLLEKVAKNEIRVSQIAVDIILPDTPAEKAEAIQTAAFRSSLFSDLRSRFPQGVPSEGNLRSYLMKQGFSDRALQPVISAYLQTCEFVQEHSVSESYGSAVPAAPQSEEFQRVEGKTAMQPSHPYGEMLSQPSIGASQGPTLNDINAQIIGRLVRIDVMLDARGLKRLKKKIDAIMTLIEDEDESDGGANGHPSEPSEEGDETGIFK